MSANNATPRWSFVVAALDFGSTYSGYAYTFKSEYEKDESKLYTNRWDVDGDSQAGTSTFKAPTVVLFDKDRKFHSFGYKAESTYAKLAETEEHLGWRYYRYFKMKLYGNDKATLHRKLRLLDDQGKRMLAIDVFAAAIKHLVDHLISALNRRVVAPTAISVNDVTWMITVPAIWTDGAKQFMQLAATQAGLPDHSVSLALEPEAAAVYISRIGMQTSYIEGKGYELIPFDVNTRFMVIDMGGGTVDMTFHEVTADNTIHQIQTPDYESTLIYSRTGQQENTTSTNNTNTDRAGENRLVEIHAPEGGQWGGNLVNEDLENFMESIFTVPKVTEKSIVAETSIVTEKSIVTVDVWASFTREPKYKECHLDLMRSLEFTKRKVIDLKGTVNISIPHELIHLFEERVGTPLKEYLDTHAVFSTMVTFKSGKLRVSPHKMISMFDRSKSRLIACLEELNETVEVSRIDTMVLVGGFAESNVIQKAIRDRFTDKTVVVPEEASLAVLKGAVMYGFDNSVIRSRIMKHTYGICVAKQFDHKIHPEKFKVNNSKGVRCENLFEVMIQAGTVVYPNETKVTRAFNGSSNVDSTEAEVSIYISPQRTPLFVTDQGCAHVGAVEFSLERECKTNEDRMVDVTLHFGHTKITVTVTEQATNNVIESCFNCLN